MTKPQDRTTSAISRLVALTVLIALGFRKPSHPLINLVVSRIGRASGTRRREHQSALGRVRRITRRTVWRLPGSADEVWPVLCNSRMTLPARSILFLVGLPVPSECYLPDGDGGPGATRKCVARHGDILQEITVWEPPYNLDFRTLEINLWVRVLISSVEESFSLRASQSGQVEVLRESSIAIKSGLGFLAPVMGLGLWQLHRYVFMNWEKQLTLAGQGRPGTRSRMFRRQ